MMASNAQIIQAVALALKDTVLPEFDASTWPASNVRACLALLAYLEDRIIGEADLLREVSTELRSLFECMVSDPEMPPLEEGLRVQLQSALQIECAQVDAPTISALERENEVYQALLSKIIGRMFELRNTIDADAYGRFREKVRACLSIIHERDFRLAARAAALVPF
jgi:hypothetical protein